MNILILNGSTGAPCGMDAYLDRLGPMLESRGHGVEIVRLRDMELGYCIGCWACWCKTPGECIIPDDSRRICRSYINADLVVFASPVTMGFVTSIMKKAVDKLIPLIHPYFEIVGKEMRHSARYDRYPALGLLLERDERTDDADVRITSTIIGRTALHLRTTLRFTVTTDVPVEEAADAADHI